MDFDPALLRAFVAVKETEGFTRAAQRLHLTQSAVSHQIRRLEEQVGRPLLHRTTRSLTLTEDGHDFLGHAERILASLDALNQRFQPSSLSGSVRFGVPETFLGEKLPPLLSRFGRAFPAVRLDVSVSTYLDLKAMIAAGELDLAVVMATPGGSEGTVLRRTRFVWVAAETFDRPRGPVPLLFSPEPCVNRRIGVEALEGTCIEWNVVFTSPSQQGIRAAVLAGLGVSVMTRGEVEPGMKVVDQEYNLPPLPTADFTLVWSRGGKTPAALEFGQMIESMSAAPERTPNSPKRRGGTGRR